MELWIAATLAAALAQTVRFMAQKQLQTAGLSATGSTLARFVFSAPVVAILLAAWLWASGQAFPALGPRFWLFAAIGGGSQILATICVVALFRHRNFAVGVTLKKTEVIQTAIVSAIVLGEWVSPGAALAILVGLGGVLALTDMPGLGRGWRRFWNPAAGLGLTSGLFFGFSGVSYRAASLAIADDNPFLRAAVTLAVVTAAQSLVLVLWLRSRQPGEITATLRAWRVAGVVGITSMIGSFCWFTAFTLQNAAYVNAVGQVELIFSVLASVFFFRETVSRREYLGIALLLTSILGLILIA